MDSEGMKAFHYQVFSGKKEDFPMFAAKLKALLAMKGCAEALSPSFLAEMPKDSSVVLDESKEDEAKKIKAKEKNLLAMSYLTMAMSKPQLMAKVEASKSTGWPEGLAFEVWSKLEKKYKPNDVLAKAEAMKDLMKLKLKKNEDPDSIADEIAGIEAKFSVTIDEEQKIAAIVSAAGRFYGDTIIQANSKASGSATADDLIEAMGEKWRIGGEGCGSDDDSVNETTLSVVNKKSRGIKCYYCGVFGHRANECPQKKKDIANGTYQSNSKLECSHCGGKGHTAEFCWDKEENKHKRPSNWKPKSSENAGGSIEILVASVDKFEFMSEERVLDSVLAIDSFGAGCLSINSFDTNRLSLSLKASSSSNVCGLDSFESKVYDLDSFEGCLEVNSFDRSEAGSSGMFVVKSGSTSNVCELDSFEDVCLEKAGSTSSMFSGVDSFDGGIGSLEYAERVSLFDIDSIDCDGVECEDMKKGERSVKLEQGRVLRGDSFALVYGGESTRYGIVEDVLDHEVSEYVNENKKF